MASSVFSLEGKAAIVTGGGSGIGKGISLGFAQSGANVVVADMDASAGEATAREIHALVEKPWFCLLMF